MNQFGLSTEQFTNLLSYLGKRDHTEDNTEIGNTANLAGTYCLLSSLNTSRWIVDSGATTHICNDINLFSNIKDISHSKHYITIPDGSKHKVTKHGTVKIHENLVLKNVFFVPNFHFNLISVIKICLDANALVVFSQETCLLQDHLTQTYLPLGKLTHGLYYTMGKVRDNTKKASQTLASVVHSNKMMEHAKLWHTRPCTFLQDQDSFS